MENEFVIGWSTLSLIVSGQAQALNRSGLLWWLFALFTGPFALFCLVVAGKNPEKPTSTFP